MARYLSRLYVLLGSTSSSTREIAGLGWTGTIMAMIVANIDFVKRILVIALIYRQEISLYTRVILAGIRESNTRKVVDRVKGTKVSMT